MTRNLLIRFTAIFLAVATLSSCATMLGSRYTKAEIKKPSKSKILVNGEKPDRKKGKIKLDKYDYSEQITITKDGYIDVNKVVFAYKMNPLKFLSLAFMIYPFFIDIGPKSKMYDKEINLRKVEMIPYPVRDDNDKEIRLNNVSLDVQAGDIKIRKFRSYQHHERKKNDRELEAVEDSENIKVDNTIFTDILNNILRESGYIDTTDKVLKDSYSNNLLLNATVEGVAFHQVGYRMIYSDLTIRWELLNYYKEPIYEVTTESRSGEYKVYGSRTSKDVIGDILNNAMEIGLVNFINDQGIQDILKGKSDVGKEKKLEALQLTSPKKYAKTVSEVLNAGVTIENGDSYGSGFYINNEGYVVTNYHVIAGAEDDIEVVDNAQNKMVAKVVRTNKANDLALLKVEEANAMALSISSSKEEEIGKTVYALGTPSSKSLSQSVSKGIISGYRKTEFGSKLIQTDVAVNAGNSGGALITKSGEVIGVVSAKLMGYGVEGVAFCIPSYQLLESLQLDL